MPRWVTVVAVAIAASALVTTAVHAQDPPPTSTSAPASAAPLAELAVVDAAGGSATANTLTLTDVAPRAVWFSDRPARQAGTYPIPELLRLFFEGRTPPNAALEFAGAGARNDVAIVELSKPRYDESARRLRFAARVLDDPAGSLAPSTALGAFVGRNDGRIPKRFDAVSVFLDSATVDGDCPGQTADGTTGSIEGLIRISCTDAQVVLDGTHLYVGGFAMCTTPAGWICVTPRGVGGKPAAFHTPYTPGGPLPQGFTLE
jgi:hypothetical protein